MCGFCIELTALHVDEIENDHFRKISEQDSTYIQETKNNENILKITDLTHAKKTPYFISRLAGLASRSPDFPVRYRQILLEELHANEAFYVIPATFTQWLSGVETSNSDLVETASRQIKEFSSLWFGECSTPRTLEQEIWYPVSDTWKEDWPELTAVTPAIMMALGILRRLGQSKRETPSLLMGIIAGQVPATPLFEGPDLWMQRVAILDYFDGFGVDGLLEHLTNVRPFLWAYLIIHRGLSAAIQAKLDEAFGTNWMENL